MTLWSKGLLGFVTIASTSGMIGSKYWKSDFEINSSPIIEENREQKEIKNDKFVAAWSVKVPYGSSSSDYYNSAKEQWNWI
ncbi:hypothetical protein MSUIS_05550 [Mycoplasma suis KI3806]|uniref:Uncharacterized protein n=1 Tax=Mycoplasma suis (strain KI_3806) TaxID=708248 RepID=F0V1W7_MYCS3|nr:hypothetical protein [Mycoplasma suis]CBZ40648.1 hypothetical protein MSUIS_05550 [Mycoplasma suis KI3806]